MRVVSFSVPAWFPAYDDEDGPPGPGGEHPAEALLTEQESAVFLCLATGASNRELALELQLSVSTVKFHVVNIRAKLGGISRLQACLLAALARESARPGGGATGAWIPGPRTPGDGTPDAAPAVPAPDDRTCGDPTAPDLSDGGAAAVPR
ncbi:LuxR C-terminal-related transcriptional regulator [Streptomyces sp. NPDC008265]|uniref:response regulator transcription factor n=1 Tax=Streptomyces sp. NPDC008265 TaxID=3364824 RepID=UPI0036E61875